ncbi:DUF5071 domain-containing protein [Mucilaginibacter sp. Bleaf8]|uniref:DUF5071 domain-containing protein n=1 Tax=Mucilaginibacter sp. Bleaf8 TaxID=2834430 RepID=UPI001BCDC783|nr:DUF5071 domain-containing protein [Mucilaginibacter sp. Bleaf8]MBS7562916.1 DUF5071 domain-containing protein [Mucilaginibacter sp. Bleaf8]
MDVKELIPKHKHDHKSIAKLKELPFEQIRPIVPDLLEWLQDLNWPIAKPLADTLKPFIERFIPELIGILNTNDVMWEYSILISLLRNTTHPLLLAEIERIAQYPTEDEIENEVNQEAIDILNGDYR